MKSHVVTMEEVDKDVEECLKVFGKILGAHKLETLLILTNLDSNGVTVIPNSRILFWEDRLKERDIRIAELEAELGKVQQS